MDELLHPTAEDTKRRWKKLEEDLADQLEGWLTVASGSKSDKGDAKSYFFLGECKYRWAWKEEYTWYIPLDLQWLEAIWRHADRKKKIPLLALEWGDGSRAFLLPERHYSKLIGEYEDEEHRSNNRIVNLPVNLTESPYLMILMSIEVPELHWVMVPWDELSWLRFHELAERKELGKQEAAKSIGGRTTWNKRSFPSRRGW